MHHWVQQHDNPDPKGDSQRAKYSSGDNLHGTILQ